VLTKGGVLGPATTIFHASPQSQRWCESQYRAIGNRGRGVSRWVVASDGAADPDSAPLLYRRSSRWQPGSHLRSPDVLPVPSSGCNCRFHMGRFDAQNTFHRAGHAPGVSSPGIRNTNRHLRNPRNSRVPRATEHPARTVWYRSLGFIDLPI